MVVDKKAVMQLCKKSPQFQQAEEEGDTGRMFMVWLAACYVQLKKEVEGAKGK